ncbi:TatD family hydrolase [Candidatus Parcubacteria bacterium]|nr:TatD family hydrolase [Candidatus Parcubacteria bacterium]
MYKYFDTHSHIHGKEFDADRGEVLTRMRDLGVGTVTIGTGLKESEAAVALAEKETDVWATVGLHPADDPQERFDIAPYRALAARAKVVGIGECGLDYFRLGGEAGEEKKRQKDLFREHLALAREVGKPLVIHCRPSPGTTDAHEDLLALLEAEKDIPTGAIHFFTGTLEVALRYVALGFYISFPGVITFKGEYDEVVRGLPLENLLVETDSPYAAPTPFRGKRNEPSLVKETAGYLANLREEGRERVLLALAENAEKLFRLAA